MKSIQLVVLMVLGLFSFGISQETGTVTDAEGNVYKTVKIGDQWWMAENLKATHYQNGDAILFVTDSTAWANCTTGAYCSYNNDEANVPVFGRLYNWHAVNDSRMIAPVGWHVPSKDEWQVLTDYLGGDAVAGGKMKTAGTVEAGTGLWNSPNAGATNESGFSALPGGRRGAYGSFVGLGFNGMAFFWSVTQGDIGSARYWYLSPTGAGLFNSTANQLTGFSLRCVQDPDNSGIESNGETPHAYVLSQNYPNPFNARTMISYSLPVACHVKITVHTLNGQRVTTLVDGFAAAGTHSAAWAADNIASALYFYRLQTEHITLVRKLILQK